MGESYDLVVVGAGPAGASAARAAAQRGVKVLLIDQRKRVGLPVQCGELVSQWISSYAPFDPRAIVQPVEAMAVHLPDQPPLWMKSPGYMLDRHLFDNDLAISAVLSGAEIAIGTKALHASSEGVLLRRGTKEEWVRARVIIAADGLSSTVARSANQPPLKELRALQYEVVLHRPQSFTEIHFHPDYEGGYAWFFPKGKRANAGVGVVPSKTSLLPELLDQFLHGLKHSGNLPRVEIVSKTGGSIPCEPRKETVVGNILFVGDAAGHAHPITGAGILNAVMGGSMAGRIAAEAILSGNLGILKNYEVEWNEAFGASLHYGFRKRRLLEENWNNKEIGFKNLIRKTWVGFREYYEERRKRRHGHPNES
ncbi:MAG: NAD(P)/FAD-dependent oxidoreductase [Desulfobacterota bacterium]|nr:NAD(P)/FAD-dependent oxidoreductase [Thermodesulfobacteriota bacterium]